MDFKDPIKILSDRVFRLKGQILTLLFFLQIFFIVSCKEALEKEISIVNVSEITNITSNSALSGGVVTSDGGAEVIARGVCWSTSQNPSIDNNKTIDGAGIGNFTSIINGLTSNIT